MEEHTLDSLRERLEGVLRDDENPSIRLSLTPRETEPSSVLQALNALNPVSRHIHQAIGVAANAGVSPQVTLTPRDTEPSSALQALNAMNPVSRYAHRAFEAGADILRSMERPGEYRGIGATVPSGDTGHTLDSLRERFESLQPPHGSPT